MISAEKINLNYTRWIDYLKKYDCYSDKMIKDIGNDIKNAPFGLMENSGGAYQGGLLNIVLNNLCVLGTHINECAFGLNDKQKHKHPFLLVNSYMLIRVLLLQHVSKAQLFVYNKSEWKAKRGQPYDFNDEITTSMRCGDRSVYLCQKYGIKLTEEEYEAMKIIDKDDDKWNPFMNPLTQLVRVVNQLTLVELRLGFSSSINKTTQEK